MSSVLCKSRRILFKRHLRKNYRSKLPTTVIAMIMTLSNTTRLAQAIKIITWATNNIVVPVVVLVMVTIMLAFVAIRVL